MHTTKYSVELPLTPPHPTTGYNIQGDLLYIRVHITNLTLGFYLVHIWSEHTTATNQPTTH